MTRSPHRSLVPLFALTDRTTVMPDTRPSRRPLAAAVLAALALASGAAAQQQLASRVEIPFNRFYDYDAMTERLVALVEAHPEILAMESIGTSEQGRAMWLVTLNDPATGPAEEKPAMWIDGNVHGNEVQAAETVLYSIWYLASARGQVPAIDALIDRTAFYFVPMVNPDGRAHWFAEPNTSSSSRTGMRPTDDDDDGRLDEDGPNDLDGDGSIGTMWRFDPNGTHRRNARDPRLIERVRPDERGELSWAGSEGVDDDGDGRINEDGPGGYDMNRNWPSDWQPDAIQRGAGDYPFDRPETRCVGRFILDHPNIAAVQSYHNAGGMILRGPGASYRESEYGRADTAVYDALGRAGEEMLPFYRLLVIHADLYTVHGGFVNWTAEGLGIISFTNELWSDRRLLADRDARLDAEGRQRWQDRVLFGQTFTDWTEHLHPTLGRVLIGGGTKWASRTPPPFMLEEECHRNFAFTMHHAAEMPRLSIPFVGVERLGPALWSVTAEVENAGVIPTRTGRAATRRIGLPDRFTLAGAPVVAAGEVSDRFDRTIDDPAAHHPERLDVEAGIPGQGRRTFRFLVTGPEGAAIDLRYEAEKARNVTTTARLAATETPVTAE